MTQARRSRGLWPSAALLLALAACVGTAVDPAPAPAPEAASRPEAVAPSGAPRWGIAIHGGAGTITRQGVPPEREAEYQAKLREALDAGHRILARGGSSLDAVQAAINVMEDSPLFNAGKGAVLTNTGTAELDASIMEGKTLNAGAVAGVQHVRNPIDAARLVMEKSPHVMLAREGADAFARENGLTMVPQEYFITEARRRTLERQKAAEANRPTSDAGDDPLYSSPDDRKYGTVGAVALDQAGNLAAGTSTGGMSNKRWGRIGDAPVIGAGTYADNASCAVSATGHGEYFIRAAVAHDICARMKYQGAALDVAARATIDHVAALGGDGGVIAMDARGNYTWPFNTAGMFRGYRGATGEAVVEMFGS